MTECPVPVLLLSSLTMVLGLAAVQRDDRWWSGFWILATALLGLHFVLNQVYEFWSFHVHEGLALSTSLFGSSFYVLTGFHGAHVFIGILLILWCFLRQLFTRYYRPGRTTSLDNIGLYWHFVDVVLIFLFTILYVL